ncbi:MAG: hypothetical protein ACO2PO_08655 [Candidatus Calescibacterium sp.]
MRILFLGINLGESSISNLHLGYVASTKKNFFIENGFEILTLNFVKFGDIIFNPGENIFDVIKKLPNNWTPDLFLIQGPEYIFLPADIHKCPFPVVFITCDFDYEMIRSRELMKLADSIVCFSDETEKIIKSFSRHTIKFPLWFGYEPVSEILKLKKTKEREIDIFYSGNMDTLLFPEKGKLILRAIEVAHKKKFKIKINPSYLKKEEYELTLSNTKICITYHRRREIQRPEVPLFGATLITNSPYFKEIYKEKEDFFVYNNFEELGEIISEAIEHAENSNFEERIERISQIRNKMLPHVRLLELIKKIQENLDEIEKSKNQRLENLKTKSKNTKEKEYDKIYNIFSIFPLVRIFPIPKNVESFLVTKSIRKLIEENNMKNKESNNKFDKAEENEENQDDIGDIIYSLKSFFFPYSILFLNEQDRKIIEERLLQATRNPHDFQTPLNLCFTKILQGNYEEAYNLLELSHQRFLNLPDEKFEKIKDNIFLLPAFPQFTTPPLIFPEMRGNFFQQGIEKKQIENLINFAKGVLIRDIPPKSNTKFSREILSKLAEKEGNFIYLLELSKTLIKIGDIEEAHKKIKEAYKNNITSEIADILLSLTLLIKEETRKEKYKEDNEIHREEELSKLKEYLKIAFIQDRYLTKDKEKIDEFIEKIFETQSKIKQTPKEKYSSNKIFFITKLDEIQDKNIIKNIIRKNIRSSLLTNIRYIILTREEEKEEIERFAEELKKEYDQEILILSDKDNLYEKPNEEDILLVSSSSDILLKNTKLLLMFSIVQKVGWVISGKVMGGGEIIAGKTRNLKAESIKNEIIDIPFLVGIKLKENKKADQNAILEEIKKFLIKA